MWARKVIDGSPPFYLLHLSNLKNKKINSPT
jgi:hypothetical protein